MLIHVYGKQYGKKRVTHNSNIMEGIDWDLSLGTLYLHQRSYKNTLCEVIAVSKCLCIHYVHNKCNMMARCSISGRLEIKIGDYKLYFVNLSFLFTLSQI